MSNFQAGSGKNHQFYGIINQAGNVDIVHAEYGEPATQIRGWNSNKIYPVGSDVSCLYDHPAGITLSKGDCCRMGIEFK